MYNRKQFISWQSVCSSVLKDGHTTPEFKEQAVKLVLEEKRCTATVARELSVSDSTLYNWVRLATLPAKSTSLESLEHENMRLKKELRVAQISRAIS